MLGRVSGLLLGVVLMLSPGVMDAQQRGTSAVITGQVVDSVTGQPIGAVDIFLAGQPEMATDGAGRFIFGSVEPGSRRLAFRRLGYRAAWITLDVKADTVIWLTVRLEPSPVVIQDLRVISAQPPIAGSGVLQGPALDRSLATSIAATIAGIPGIVQRYNGPAAAQPVVRGLGGDRVLVLEDGLQTGDIATTAADHAVTVDPLGARRIEVVRGPASLLYGGNVLGGVINVVREDIPTTHPDRIRGNLRLQGESVSRGLTAGGDLSGGLGPLAFRGELTQRHAGDTRTADGLLPRTDLDGYDLGLGVSWVGEGAHLGVALRDYTSFYGIPSVYQGQVIPGAHAGGVYVDLRRTAVRVAGARQRETGWLRSVQVEANAVRFVQDELEQGGLVGTRFGQLQGTGQLIAHYRRDGALPADGVFSLSIRSRDLRAQGSYTGTRPAVLTTLGAFAMETHQVGAVTLLGGLRIDRTRISPWDTTSSRYLRDPRPRTMTTISGAFGALATFGDWELAPSVTRAVRTPALEELYSNGPHLANYAYEVGNPALRPERAFGLDLTIRHDGEAVTTEFSLFRNVIDDFVHQAALLDPATGRPVLDHRLRRYVVYQAQQTDALLHGAEGILRWQIVPALQLETAASVVVGSVRRSGEPLPSIPPAQGRATLRHEAGRWFGEAGINWGLRQERVPTRPLEPDACGLDAECAPLPIEYFPTPGHFLGHAAIGVRFPARGLQHALTLRVDNLANAAWYDHLSRIRAVAPQPGRNVALLYRVTF